MTTDFTRSEVRALPDFSLPLGHSTVARARRQRLGPLRQVTIIAAKEFSDRLRSGWVIACVLVWLGAIGLTSFLGLLQIGRIGVQGYERTVTSLLNLAQYLVPLLGLLLGHDLIVSEKEEQTLRLILAGGVSRTRLLLGKFLGGSLTLSVPLGLGFAVAGTAIGVAAKDNGFGPFLVLALSAVVLGILFLSLGLALSAFSRSRVQALVLVLLTWCLAVFVFDLVALAVLVSTKAAPAAQEIDLVCDATHVNLAADLHSAYDNPTARSAVRSPLDAPALGLTPPIGWLAINPIDLFRAVNLPQQTGVPVPAFTLLLCAASWLIGALALSRWRLRRIDL